jgi:hypothetical protein
MAEPAVDVVAGRLKEILATARTGALGREPGSDRN